MKYNIVEDCSPYFIRFTHANINAVIAKAVAALDGVSLIKQGRAASVHPGFVHHRPQQDLCDWIHASVPMNEELDLDQSRAAMFITRPGYYYQAHKDKDHRYSLNYGVRILDAACITSWYSEEECANYRVDPLLSHISKDLKGFDKTKHRPLKTMIAKPDECCLFNTEIFHDWDNSASTNVRIVMTLRDRCPEQTSFFDARKKLFDY